MPRMKDCRECHANDIPKEEWDYANDGAYPPYIPREARKEHTYCGLRMGGGATAATFNLLMFRPNGDYVGTLIHKGRKP